MSSLSYARHRFPSVIIQHAVWLYFRFALSYRDVEDMLAERGITPNTHRLPREPLEVTRTRQWPFYPRRRHLEDVLDVLATSRLERDPNRAAHPGAIVHRHR